MLRPDGGERMPRWFLSYHSRNEKLAARLKSAVDGRDPSLSVFFAPTHLRAGTSSPRSSR